jgi:hypothetical protein
LKGGLAIKVCEVCIFLILDILIKSVPYNDVVRNEMFIFIDESGDLGFSAKSSSFFLVTAITAQEPKIFQRIFKKARNKLKKKLADIPEFKFCKTDHALRLFILNELSKTGLSAYVYFIDKKKTKDHLKKTQHVLYNYITGRLIEHVLMHEGLGKGKIHIVIDKSLYNSARESFDHYVTYIRTPAKLSDSICISHKKSDEEAGLQAVDFLCGAIFHKLEFKKENYYQIIKDKIKAENKMW